MSVVATKRKKKNNIKKIHISIIIKLKPIKDENGLLTIIRDRDSIGKETRAREAVDYYLSSTVYNGEGGVLKKYNFRTFRFTVKYIL